MTCTVWYLCPLDSPGGGYQEITDPQGNYLKPDTNIAVPSGMPITSIDSGVITNVSNRPGGGDGGLSVTMKLDHPPNNLAQYASYNFLGSSTVSTGQRVQAGQQVGVAGSPTGINFALALGVSPSWGTQCPQCGSKQPLLDPRIILNSLRAGKGLPTNTGTGTPNNALSSLPFGLDQAIPALQQSFTNLAEEAAIFIIALMIIILGVMLLAGKQIGGAAKKGIEVGATI